MLLRVYCLLFILILFLPTLQHSLNILPSTTLVGKETDPPRANWSSADWLDGSFQEQYSKRRDTRLGLRDYLIKTYNQLHYSLFHRITSTTGTDVVIGKGNWLYEKVYIAKHNTASKDDGSLVEARVQRLRNLQDQLEGLGITFVFVIAPSKAELYSEYIPDRLMKDQLAPGVTTDYQQTRASLERNGVHFVDCHTLFQEEKRDKDYQLFGPSGVHWNKYGAYLAWKNLAPLVNNQLKVPLQIPTLDRIESRPSEPVEADLGGILNLWDSDFTSPVTDYPVFAVQSTEITEKPSLLIIGDSFLFTLVDIVKRANLATDVDAWYYFRRHFKYRAKEGQMMDLSTAIDTPLDKKAIDWQNQLFGKDLVILVATECGLPELGFGFIEEASAAIERSASDKVINF
jgi:SGNH hydrolase-like domain, acetyltransferase AlgX